MVCASSFSERWTNKMMTLVIGAACFFVVALIVLTRPAPSLKIDRFLVAAHIRVAIRRLRKQTLRRLHERDLRAEGSTITRSESVVVLKLLDEGKLEEVVSLRRAAMAASSAVAAIAAINASSPALSPLTEQLAASAGDTIGDATRGALGEIDTNGERGARAALVDASNLAGGEGLGSTLVSGVKSLAVRTQSWFDPGQIKILMGNLQINASLTVVFAIPWPPIHTHFIEMLNVFKLDVFKGLSFAMPCLHSTHFMSLAMFTAMPLVLIGVFSAALGIVAAAGLCRAALPRKTRSCVRKLPCGKFTAASARTSAVKVTIVTLLFIYPTICSNVFMTFKCVDLGASGSYMVADMAIQCYETEWLIWAGVAGVALVLYVVGIPVALLLLLAGGNSRGTLHYPAIKTRTENHITSAEVTTAVHRTEAFFSNRLAYGNLYTAYEPKSWWFECCCTMRKMILTGALVIFGPGTSVQVVTALIICIAWIMLLSNLGPYDSDLDGRLAQVEALQVLFTLLIGLVLQLEALQSEAGRGAGNPQNSLGAALIVLNVAVVLLAVIQQPLVLILWKKLSAAPRRCALRWTLGQEWANVAIMDATDEDYANAITLFDWCDVGGTNPRILPARPRAFVEVGAASAELKQSARRLSGHWGAGEILFFDSTGKRVIEPIHAVGDDGSERWFDGASKQLLEGRPIELMEAESFSSATHWLDTHTDKLLSQRPA
jgi:hypothetical protein